MVVVDILLVVGSKVKGSEGLSILVGSTIIWVDTQYFWLVHWSLLLLLLYLLMDTLFYECWMERTIRGQWLLMWLHYLWRISGYPF